MIPNEYSHLFLPNILLLGLILSALSLLHFYWAFGGTWGFANTLPTKENGDRLFTPKKIHSFIVGIGLLGVVGFLIFTYSKIPLSVMEKLSSYVILAFLGLGIIFLIRAIGEFRYVGFFKKTKNTPFGILDTRIYSPLCLLIAILFFLVLRSMPMEGFIYTFG